MKYRFFVPVEESTSTEPPELQVLKAHSKGLLDYRGFETADFSIHAATDYIIVNPRSGRLQAFFRLPIENEDRDDLWVKVDETSAIKFRERFEDYWNTGKRITYRAGS